MGNENSTPAIPIDPSKAWRLDRIAEAIKNGAIKKVVIFTGAGISTAAGIPDFRSPETGLYANLERLNLPYPEAVFDISFFRQNPEPFYALAHELYPGKFRPTLAHCLIRLLHDKGLLLKVFTQNIDCLEREAGVPDAQIIEAHGSFATQRCIDCSTVFPDDEMRAHVERMEVPHCPVPQCNGLVKPDIVFFGQGLPEAFFNNVQLPAQADLGIVMGTSLTVYPFAALPQTIGRGIPRLLINKEKVGDLGTYPEDVLILGDIEEGVRRFASILGWTQELERIWQEKNPNKTLSKKETAKKSRDEAFQEELDQLTRDVEESLQVSAQHSERVKRQLATTDSDTVPDMDSDISSKGTESGKAAGPPSDDVARSKEDTEVDGLQHVFPHIDGKSSL